jgi:predicted dehydrogenase
MVLFDDLEPSEKVKVYDKGITLNGSSDSLYQMLIGYRAGDMWAPQLDITEALRTEGMHFLDCIREGKRPTTDGEAGLQIVRILEAATQSMKLQGQMIELATLNSVGVAA